MARSFATSTDRVNYGAKTGFTVFSLCFWIKNPTTAGDHVAFNWDSLLTVNFISSNCPLDLDNVGSRAGKWTSSAAQHGMTLTNWNHVAWTHDSTNVANDPILYINGVSKAFSETVTPTQAVQALSKTIRVGNYSNDALSLGGSMGYVGLYNVVLTAAEVAQAMQYGYAPRGLVIFSPLWGDSPEPDYSGNRTSGTVTGATVVAGPPVRYGLLAQPSSGAPYVVAAGPPPPVPTLLTVQSALSWG